MVTGRAAAGLGRLAGSVPLTGVSRTSSRSLVTNSPARLISNAWSALLADRRACVCCVALRSTVAKTTFGRSSIATRTRWLRLHVRQMAQVVAS